MMDEIQKFSSLVEYAPLPDPSGIVKIFTKCPTAQLPSHAIDIYFVKQAISVDSGGFRKWCITGLMYFWTLSFVWYSKVH
jgi:hypothetical protein